MGFEGKKIIRLRFEDDLEGLEVTTRCPTIEQILAVQDVDTENTQAVLTATAGLLIETLIGWNLENDGEPVPHTAEALLAQDANVSQAIIGAWEDNAIKLGPKAAPPSNDGLPSLVASIPMDTESPSLAS